MAQEIDQGFLSFFGIFLRFFCSVVDDEDSELTRSSKKEKDKEKDKDQKDEKPKKRTRKSTVLDDTKSDS